MLTKSYQIKENHNGYPYTITVSINYVRPYNNSEKNGIVPKGKRDVFYGVEVCCLDILDSCVKCSTSVSDLPKTINICRNKMIEKIEDEPKDIIEQVDNIMREFGFDVFIKN